MKKISNRILAIAMCICMICGMLQTMAFAAEHVHNAECGYSEPAPCNHTTHDDTCAVCGEADQTVAPPTNDKTIWFILIAVAAGAVIVLTVVYGKKRKSRV